MTNRRSLRWLASTLLLVGFGVLFWAPFNYDDPAFILRNPLVVGSWSGLRSYFLGSYFLGEYEPLNFLLHRALWLLGGGSVFVYRLSSLLLHAANALLAYRLFRRLLGAPVTAWWTALLVALYPAHAEALAVSVFKKHLLVAFFALAALNVQGSELRPWLREAAAWLLGAAALGCRESGAVLPLLAASYAWCRASWPRDRALVLGQLGVVLCYAGFRAGFVPRHFERILEPGLASHLLTSGKALLWDVGQLALPTSICIEHSLGAVTTAGEALLVLAGLAALGWGAFALRGDRVALFGVLWTLIALAPTLNVIPFANYSLVANRYLYLASFGFYLLWARLAMRFARARLEASGYSRVVPPLIAAVTALGALRAAAVFCDPVALWRHAAQCAPDNPRAHGELGRALQSSGDLAGAETEYRRAIAADPDYLWAYTGLSGLYSQTGRFHQAYEAAWARVARRPDADAYFALGMALAGGGSLKTARPAFEKAVALDAQPRFRLYLGTCYKDLGLKQRALEQWRLAAQGSDPDISARANEALAASGGF